MRQNNIERTGIYKIGLITDGDLGWVFREQPIVDVGIDGTIEQSTEGNPGGKFLAVQIKSGSGNFHISEKHLTYYISNVHYQYWMSVEFPVLLLAYIPETDEVYWQEINKKNIIKTTKQWKLEIPKDQIFNVSAKNELSELFSTRTLSEVTSSLYSEEDLLPVDFDQTVISILKIANLLREITGEHTGDPAYYLKKHSLNLEKSILNLEMDISKNMMLTSKRIKNELILFTELYISEVRAFERYIRLTLSSSHLDVLVNKVLKEPIQIVSDSFHKSISGIEAMILAVNKISSEKEMINLAKTEALSTLKNLEKELRDADSIMNNLGKLQTLQ